MRTPRRIRSASELGGLSTYQGCFLAVFILINGLVLLPVGMRRGSELLSLLGLSLAVIAGLVLFGQITDFIAYRHDRRQAGRRPQFRRRKSSDPNPPVFLPVTSHGSQIFMGLTLAAFCGVLIVVGGVPGWVAVGLGVLMLVFGSMAILFEDYEFDPVNRTVTRMRRLFGKIPLRRREFPCEWFQGVQCRVRHSGPNDRWAVGLVFDTGRFLEIFDLEYQRDVPCSPMIALSEVMARATGLPLLPVAISPGK